MSADPELPSLAPAFSPTLDARACAEHLSRGCTLEQIAADTNTPLETVKMLANDPAAKYLVGKRATRTTGGVFDVEKALTDETERTFDTILGLRDGAEKDEVRLRAAVELFDRQRPKITKNETEMTVRISLSHEQQALATNLEDEVRTLDAEFASYEPAGELEKPDAE